VAVAWSSVTSNLAEIDAVRQTIAARRSQIHCYCMPTAQPHRTPA
jgi:hypothetical protein